MPNHTVTTAARLTNEKCKVYTRLETIRINTDIPYIKFFDS